MKFLLSKNGKYLFAKHNSTIRADLNGNVYGGGWFSNLFGRGREPAPQVKVPTAQELFQTALGQAREAFPSGFEAREAASQQLMQPFGGIAPLDFGAFGPTQMTPAAISPVDWAQFQPTTFEQGLATSQFAPLVEQAQRQALQIGSLAGIPSAAPAHFGRAISPAMLQIGEFLAQQGQQRGLTEQQRLMQEAGFGQQAGMFNVQAAQQMAQMEQQRRLQEEAFRQSRLQLGLGAAPTEMLMPLAQLGGQQAGQQAQADLLNWQAQQQQMGGGSALLSLLGMGAGAALAPLTAGTSLAFGPLAGALGGGVLGGMAGTLAGGGQAPLDIGTALQIGQLPRQFETQDLLNQLLQKQIGGVQPVG